MKGRIGFVLALIMVVGLALGAGAWFGRKAAIPPPAPNLAPAPPIVKPAPSPETPAYDNIFPRAQSERIPVIMYHDIVAKRGRGSVWFDCTRAEFEEQIQWLTEQGAHPISLDDLYRHLSKGDPVPAKAVVLTFDDNYQGFYDYAYPLLKQNKIPAAMFVHTNFVGDKTGDHPHMDWLTLQQLDKEGLVTIGSHTLSHPDDMRLLSPEEQEKEMTGAKRVLEEKLGHPIPYFAYPNGKADATTRDVARKVGYTMAFTIDNGLAEESPDILLVNRYIQTRLQKAWQDAENARENAPAAYVEHDLSPTPIRLEVAEYADVKLGLIRGGTPTSRRGLLGRESVGQFIQDAGGVAGINGTFFADARIRGTDATLIGPSQTVPDNLFIPESDDYRLKRIVNRPLVIWGPKKIAIFPFQSGTMNEEQPFHALMPDYTDLFMAGAWIVHDGVARTQAQMKAYSAGDFRDPRRRAFFGFTSTGEIVVGASLEVITTMKLAEAAAAAGVQEAVLLDSGFSTSLVYDGKIIVTGHTAKNIPSRPVPHSIVLMGELQRPTDPDTMTALQLADNALAPPGSVEDPDQPADATTAAPPHHRRRRRHSDSDATKEKTKQDDSNPDNSKPDDSKPDNSKPDNPPKSDNPATGQDKTSTNSN
ncbi:MAG TPA: polysaccharide deacetylase family protein [Chthonomonadaceae bacterium]|nr:polysaccharide deacetylase family protein [Chthonomonadaceae bacterium]